MIKLLPFLFLFLSCSVKKDVVDNSFSIIHNSEFGGSEKPGHLVIDNNESYIQFIDSLKLDESQYANFLRVDFKNHNVLVLFQGQQYSGGFQISIESLTNNNQTIIVKKKEIGPKKGEMATSVLTVPYCIALIPKSKTIIIE